MNRTDNITYNSDNKFSYKNFLNINESANLQNKKEVSLNQELSLRKKKHFEYYNPIANNFPQNCRINSQTSSISLNLTNPQPKTSHFNNTSSPEKYIY